MKITNVLKKDARKVNGKIKPYEKDPRSWNVHQKIVIVGGTMILLSLYSKILNISHWAFVTKFDMSSYPPEVAYIYMFSSLLALLYGYLKEDKVLELIGLIGLGYTLIFLWGMFQTYYC